MSIILHALPYNIKDYSIILVHDFYYLLLVTVICVNVYLSCCITNVGNDNFGGNVFIRVCPWYFLRLLSYPFPQNNLS